MKKDKPGVFERVLTDLLEKNDLRREFLDSPDAVLSRYPPLHARQKRALLGRNIDLIEAEISLERCRIGRNFSAFVRAADVVHAPDPPIADHGTTGFVRAGSLIDALDGEEDALDEELERKKGK